MKGFIVYPIYQVMDLGPKILLFGRLENGQSFLTINSYEPYFFIEEFALKKAGSVLNEYHVVKTDFKSFNKKKVVKIIVDIPATVPILRKKLEDKGIKCYEADIRFAYRYLIDKDIKGSIDIEGDYETSEYVDRIYYEPTINPADFIPKLKVFSLDIETSPDNKKIYSIAIYSESLKKVFLISDKKIKEFFTFKDEESLLEEFRKTVIEEDPDIITGWGVVDFDLMVLKEKFKEYEIPFILGRTDKQCTIRKAKGFFMASKADFPGRMVLDGVNLLRESFVKLDDYKLSSAASKFLGDKKNINDNNKVEEIERLFAKDKEKLAEYNLKDAELVYRILEKLDVINLSIKRSLLTGMQLDRVGASISSIDSLYIRESKKKGYVVVSADYGVKEKPITGGYVMESLPGIYDNLIMMDFKSLYPSIIRTFGIDPFLYAGNKGGKNLVIAPNKAAFRNEEGILPKIITDLMKERRIVINNKDELT
ncbi:DNA polymerase II, partial [Candidatus Woesearchaeota archaeon]|nr:DNA polymerase II [Candidatus Woesearchaeota archaeon]